MSYVPNPTDINKPVGTDLAKVAAPELRALKAYLATKFGPLDGLLSAFSNPNLLINSNFTIAERGNSQTSSGYGSADRWLNAHSGGDKTTSRFEFQVGHTEVPDSPRHYLRTVVFNQSNAAHFASSEQRIESVRTAAGQQVTLSFYAKSGLAGAFMSVDLVQFFGTGSSSSTIEGIGATKIALTQSYAKYTITFNVPSIALKVIGTNNDDYLAVRFWYSAGSTFNDSTASLGLQVAVIDITTVKLEIGSVATKYIQPPIRDEIRACRRYYETYRLTGVNPANYSFMGVYHHPTAFIYEWYFKELKRATPVFSLVNSAAWLGGTPVIMPAIELVRFFSDGVFLIQANTNPFAVGTAIATADAEL
jgi:hypothetical protein